MSDERVLRSTEISRCLEKKLLFFGYELADVLVIFLLLSSLNLTFGQTEHKLVLVWLPSILLAATIRIAKRGKPDGFLIHWFRYQTRPRILDAFPEPTVRVTPPRILNLKVIKR